jgi:hypothetical protein
MHKTGLFVNPIFITMVIGVLVVVGAVLAWNFIPHRCRLERFADRDELSLDSIYSQFFTVRNLPKELVLELWNEVAVPLRIPPGKLRPSDSFDKELAPVKGWEFDDDIVEVHWAAERRLKRIGVKVDYSNVHTLGDYVEFFCRLELAKPPKGVSL